MISRRTLLVFPLWTIGAPAASPARRGDLGKAGNYSMRLRSIVRTRESRVTFGAAPSRAASGTAVIDLDLTARQSGALDALVPGALAGACSARDDRNRPVPGLQGSVVPGEEGAMLRLRAEGLSPGVQALREVRGQLSAYPSTRRIRFHVPWLKDEIPLRVEFDGGTATLSRFHLVGADSTLWIAVRPPAGFRLAALEQTGGISARAVDIDGNLVNGGGITRIEILEEGPEPMLRLYAPTLRRTPSRLMLDVLCVSGRPRPVPLRIPHIPLFPADP